MNYPSEPIDQRVLSGRYRIIRRLGTGGMALVFLAQDLRLERMVAIKVIHSHLNEDPAFATRFQREAVMAARLNHPNLVNVFDQGIDSDQPYLVMEYVPGRTLREVLSDFGSLTPRQMTNLMQEVLSGLAAAHDAGIVHRDLKPENVLLADDGRVKLGDFGLARPMTNQTSSDSVIGTAAYLAPEILQTGQADARSDVYSAGIMIFELLTGLQPFSGDFSSQVAAQHLSNAVPRPSKYKPELPESIDDLVLYATERDPNLRPANAGELLRALVQIKDGSNLNRSASNTEVISPANRTELITSTNQTEVLSNQNATETIGSRSINQDDTNGEDSLAVLERHQVRRPFLRWVTASILAIVLGSSIGWFFGAGPGALRSVPNLEGRTTSAAVAALESLGFKTSVKTQNSATVAEGLVIATDPSKANVAVPGTEVVIFSSIGPLMLEVPDIRAKDVASATEAILAAGFTFGGAEAWFDSLPVGQVFDYLGSDGKKLPSGSAITVKISLGPLPSVANIPQQTAVDLLNSVGLKINKIETQYSESVRSGNVINMIPLSMPAGEGTKVDLVVSKGSQKVTMPKVIGETISAAASLLESLGLRVIIDTNKLQSQYGIAKVNGVSIAAGTIIDKGSSVTIRSK